MRQLFITLILSLPGLIYADPNYGPFVACMTLENMPPNGTQQLYTEVEGNEIFSGGHEETSSYDANVYDVCTPELNTTDSNVEWLLVYSGITGHPNISGCSGFSISVYNDEIYIVVPSSQSTPQVDFIYDGSNQSIRCGYPG